MANEFANVDYREKIKKLTLFDAILFRKAFDLNIPAAESLLRTILENDKIKDVYLKNLPQSISLLSKFDIHPFL